MANRAEPDPGPRARPGPSRSLTLDEITAAAVRVADAGGLTATTMRSIAAEVGLSAAGLYRYVASRDELIGQMVDRLSAEVPHPEPTGDWIADLTAAARNQLVAFTTHPWLVEAVGSLRYLGPHVLDHLDWGLSVLDQVDAPDRDKLEAIALVNGAAALFAAPSRPAGPQTLTGLDPHRHRWLIAAVSTQPAGRAADDLFDRVLAGILHGVLGTR